MEHQPLNIALLGCGRIARKHAELLSNNQLNARLVAVCDVDPVKSREYAEKYNVPGFTDLQKMMMSIGDGIDVISVLTPTGCHAQNTIDIASYKKHVIVEKPMALTLDDAEAMVHACDIAGVKLFVVKQNRYNAPIKKLAEAIAKGRFGKISMATARVRWCRDQKYYDQADWRGTWLMDGGVFANQASHHVDLLRWLVGEVDSVFSYTSRRFADIEAEDTGIAVLKFRNGALGCIEATTAARPTDLEASISILGEHGTVEVGGFAVNKMLTWQFDHEEPGDDTMLETCNQAPPNVYGFGHHEYLEHVIESINGTGSAMVDGMEGMKSLRLLVGIYESAAAGEEISLRLSNKHSYLGQKMHRRREDSESVVPRANDRRN